MVQGRNQLFVWFVLVCPKKWGERVQVEAMNFWKKIHIASWLPNMSC